MSNESMSARDLRDRNRDELVNFVREKSEELFKLRFQHYTGQLENTARLKTLRRELARARTIIGQLDRGEVVPLKAVDAEPPEGPDADAQDADEEEEEE